MSTQIGKKITIDILSDVVCPWCVIGYHRLKMAINLLGINDQVNFNWHPFELNPNMPAEGENLREHLAKKYGTTLNGSVEARKKLTQLGASVGFTINYFDAMKMFNTRQAHLLLQWSAEKGRQSVFAEDLFQAYFSSGKDISKASTLLDIAVHSGLNRDEAASVLQSKERDSQLMTLEDDWLSRGFHGVPVIIFAGKKILPGAQEVDAYKQALEKVLASYETVSTDAHQL